MYVATVTLGCVLLLTHMLLRTVPPPLALPAALNKYVAAYIRLLTGITTVNPLVRRQVLALVHAAYLLWVADIGNSEV